VSIRPPDMVTWPRIRASGLYSSSGVPFVLFLSVPSTGSGSLPHAKTLTRLPSSRGSMAASVMLSVNRFSNT
jgi:hypothetical protein